ncbi:MAG: hypothetical protein HY726_06145 [Candidatus Rokubacteria bacterium]|nr:hypothetical protein [Candidatus Rokubacteria bacterium]
MPLGTLTITLRPIKLAFLVDPSDTAAIRQAIRINSFLWGGKFNPIIPLVRRRPKPWRDPISPPPLGPSLVSGYLDAFDPDFVVVVGSCSAAGIDVGNRKLLNDSDILQGVIEDRIPQYGVGLFELLEYLLVTELKFVRRVPIKFCFPRFRKHRLFLESVFGSLPPGVDGLMQRSFPAELAPEMSTCSLSSYSETLASSSLYPLRLSSLYISRLGAPRLGRETCIFVLDATDPLDVIDYWNLRAIGWDVVPVPTQGAKLGPVGTLARQFIEENYWPYRDNPSLYHRTTILKSRCTTIEDLEAFIQSLSISNSRDPDNPKYLKDSHYPRIWDEWARTHDDATCCDLEADTRHHDLAGLDERVSFRTLDPKFIARFDGYGSPRFANRIELRQYGRIDPVAEVIPEGDSRLVWAIGGIGFDEWRFSKKGMTYLSRFTDWPVQFTIPKAEDMFIEWLKSKQWSAGLSPAGRLAKQMLIQLGGVFGTFRLANEKTIELLSKMAGGGTVAAGGLWEVVRRIASQEEIVRDPKIVLKHLIEAKMFQLGIELQCPVCTQRSWYSVQEASYELECGKCLSRFPLPSDSPRDIAWSYRALGPFSLPKQGYGVYSVLLTLRFFSHLRRDATTPLLSFTARKDGQEKEVDLGMLLQYKSFGIPQAELILAECKTFNPFTRDDCTRMRTLAESFPGAVLVFATLKKVLTAQEKRLLGGVVNRGRRYWKAERPFNPVVILTGTELFSNVAPPYCWQKASGSHRRFAEEIRTHDLLKLCDVTQQLYLGLPPWHQWRLERLERRRIRRATRKRRGGTN